MTHPHDDARPVEHDPTGMRDLLASLPDPGPMPDDLVARISAALADEAGGGAGAGPRPANGTDAVPHPRAVPSADVDPHRHPEPGEDETAGRVVPLRRGIRVRHLGVAAAVVTALGLGGYALGNLPGGGVTASLSAGSGDDSGAAVQEQSDSAARVAPEAGSGEVVVVMSGLDHASAGLEETARALDAGGYEPLSPLAAEAPGIGPVATPIGARSCADALGIPATAGLLVDVAEVDGSPAAVLVVHDEAGRTAYAVDRFCTSGTTGLIRGPVSLDP